MKTKRIISLAIALVMCVSAMMLAGCQNKDSKPTIETPLVVAYDPFSEKFSPFYADTAYDQDVVGMTQLGLLTTDRVGGIIYNSIEGEKVSYNGTEYTYTGITDIKVTQNDTNNDGETDTTVYEIKLKKGVKFSDGKEMTADDIIFTYYVYLDPAYVGSTTLNSYDIQGLQDYVTQTTSEVYSKYQKYAEDIYAAGSDHEWTSNDSWTKELQDAYWASMKTTWTADVQAIVDYVIAKYKTGYAESNFGKPVAEWKSEYDVAFGMAMWGFGSFPTIFAEAADGTYGFIEAEGGSASLLADGTFEADGKTGGYARKNIVDGAFYTKDDAGEYGKTDDGYVLLTELTDYSGDKYTKTEYTGKLYAPSAKDFNTFIGASTGNYWYFDQNQYPTIDDYYTETYLAYDGDPDAYWGTEAADDSDVHGTNDTLFIAKYGSKEQADISGTADGELSVKNISGIEKIDDYNVKVTINGYSAPAIYHICGITVAPAHYYGDGNMDYTKGYYAHPYGDLSMIQAKTNAPMGAGAYKYVKYENKIVYFEANEYYYKGCPKLHYIQFKEINEDDKIASIQTGAADVANPSGDKDKFNQIRKLNGGELDGAVINTSAIDNLGYGYIGINADTVNVAGKADSEASKNLRKGLATVLSVYRDVAMDSYYGDAASVINYPISNTSWAAPQKSDEGYKVAYSMTVDGKDIYTSEMTADQKYDAALAAAKDFFAAAGYTDTDGDGKFDTAPEGAKLEYEIMIPGEGKGSHPNNMVLTLAKASLAKIGITLTINDLTESTILWNRLDAGSQELWTAAWGSTIDPDMYQVYFSGSIVGKGGSDSNHYHIADADLDKFIVDARKSADQTYRKSVYKQCLDIILDWGVELPVYQRQNIIIFSTARVNMSTVTPDITTYWGWMNDIEQLEVVTK